MPIDTTPASQKQDEVKRTNVGDINLGDADYALYKILQNLVDAINRLALATEQR